MSIQTLVDAREDLNIRAYEVWQGWARQHALAEIERQVRGEVEGIAGDGRSRLSFACVALGLSAVVLAALSAVSNWSVSGRSTGMRMPRGAVRGTGS